MQAFYNAQQRIRDHNEKYAQGEVTYKRGLNHLSDLPPKEYQRLNGLDLIITTVPCNIFSDLFTTLRADRMPISIPPAESPSHPPWTGERKAT